MKAMIKTIVAAAVLISVQAQLPPPREAVRANEVEMRKLEFLIGEWRGEGWGEPAPGERRPFDATESVQSRLNGAVLVLEGVHRSKVPGKQAEVILHHGLSVISYDPQRKHYRFEAHQMDGRLEESPARLSNGVFEWSAREGPEGAETRFSIRLTDKGDWHQIGEFSQDGNWKKFFEMTLHRVSSRGEAERRRP